MKLYDYPIKKTFSISLILITFAVTGGSITYNTVNEFAEIDQTITNLVIMEGNELQGIFNDSLQRKEISQLNRVISAMSARENFVASWISGPDGIVLASYKRKYLNKSEKNLKGKYKIDWIPDPSAQNNVTKVNGHIIAGYPLVFGRTTKSIAPNRIGWFWLIYDTKPLRRHKLGDIIASSLFFAFFIFLLLAIFSVTLYRTAIGRLYQTFTVVEHFASGERNINFIQPGRDEIAQLSHTLQEMADTIHHDEKLLAEKEIRLKQYVDTVDQYVITSRTNSRGIITDVSEAFCKISGFSRQELIGKSHRVVRHPDMPVSLFKDLWDTIKQGKIWHGEIKNKRKNGSFYWVDVKITPTVDTNKKITEYTAIRMDITDRKKIEEIAIKDELTQLYNRRYFNQLFQSEINSTFRNKNGFCFILFDIDYFKRYNDTYGHHAGDVVLQKIGELLNNTLQRSGDNTFRMGGEEFAVIPQIFNPEDVENIVHKIRTDVENLKIEHKANDASPWLTVSLGACYVNPGKEAPEHGDTIYKIADKALYEAKEQGRNRHIIKII